MFFIASNAQEVKKESVFKGSLNNETIEMYIQTFEQECTADIYYIAMLRFDDHKYQNITWRKFEVFANDNNGYILIDDPYFSGRYSNYIFIEQNGHQLKGFIKNEKLSSKPIILNRDTDIKDFSNYREKMTELTNTDDC